MKPPSCSRFSVTISFASCQDALTFLLCRLMRKSGLSLWKWRYCISSYIHELGTGVLRGILGIFLYLHHFELTPSVYLVLWLLFLKAMSQYVCSEWTRRHHGCACAIGLLVLIYVQVQWIIKTSLMLMICQSPMFFSCIHPLLSFLFSIYPTLQSHTPTYSRSADLGNSCYIDCEFYGFDCTFWKQV